MSELRSPKRRREQLVRSLRAQGRSWVEVAEVLRQCYRLNARVALRYAHGWSQRQAADEWNRRWPDELKTFKNFSSWEQWPSSTGHAPSFDNFSKLAQLYECAVIDLLVDLPDFRHLDIVASTQETRLPMPKPGTGLVLPEGSATRQPLSDENDNGRAVGPVEVCPVGCGEPKGSSVPTRREVFGYFGAGVTTVGLDQVTAGLQGGLPRVVQALEVTRQAVGADPAGLEDLNAVVEHYKKTFRSAPPAELYNEILGVRVHAGTLLDGERAANNRTDLLMAAGWLSNLLALVTHELHDRAASLVWCADAERYSREAHYPDLGGWAALIRVRMSFYDGQAREAVTHCQRGQQLAPLGTVAHAALVTQEMRAWALLGNSDKVSSTRWRAEKAIAKLPPDTPTLGAFSISLADDPPYTATSLLLLGRHKEAVEAVLGLDTVIRYQVEVPSILTAPSCVSWACPIFEAVLSPTDAARRVASEFEANADSHLDSLVNLRRAVATVMQAELSSDYAQLAQSLPSLIGRIELANLQARDDDRLPLQRLLSDVYLIAGWTLIKADSPAAAWIAAQRAIQFAEQADDLLRRAAATRCLAEVHMRAKSLHEASRTAFLAATCLDTIHTLDKDTVLCLRGAALLSAAAASARRGDRGEARMALKAAAVCAAELKEERCELGTVFGPVNLAIHRVAVATELGDASEAVTYIPRVNLDRMPSHLAERRARFLIDAARIYTQLQDDTAALAALLHAEAIAPDELRNHRLTQDVVRELLSRERRSSGLRALANRCALLN